MGISILWFSLLTIGHTVGSGRYHGLTARIVFKSIKFYFKWNYHENSQLNLKSYFNIYSVVKNTARSNYIRICAVYCIQTAQKYLKSAVTNYWCLWNFMIIYYLDLLDLGIVYIFEGSESLDETLCNCL